MNLHALALVDGHASGPVAALAEPLSFWGGFDAVTGSVTDRRHPDHGRCLSGTVLLLAAARGSSSGASVLAEAIRLGTAPAGFVLTSRDAILTVGAQVAAELYARACPIVVVAPDELVALARAKRLTITARDGNGVIGIEPSP
jgi:predicted aconitase with swiveling domain